ncbi:mechanosensitive ion channel [Asticcacaulis sp. BYS171W]|uniref:Mechanosensitive ion channel n=1 Tax=Asticcacaulis aquaticus TaxID=2984212 RepID=A0ABT5HRJ4_9CAUL|nr:mechanosensitive ion channel domain-containing protein [Asticcacaulis aquaticus]MDC7682696.1 mechanosensitive ion channel [Asticcacaulis aquaticus]
MSAYASVIVLPDRVDKALQSLDRFSVPFGKYNISILDALNFVVVTVAVYVAARLIYWVASRVIGRVPGLDGSQKHLMQKFAAVAVVVVAGLIGVDMLGIDLTTLAVFSGAFGLAIGFGMQKTLGNLIAGLILLMDRSIKPGDVVAVADTFGVIGKIGVRAVSVLTRDGKEHLIPNELLMTQPLENWSYSDRNVRLHIQVGVSYKSDLDLAQKLMLEACAANPRVLKSPEPRVWLMAFGENRIEHDIRVWIDDPELGVYSVKSDILNHLWRSFKAHGIEIALPQREVYVKEYPLPEGEGGPKGR